MLVLHARVFVLNVVLHLELHRFETISVGHVEYRQAAVCISVICLGHRLESLLAGRVPYLHFDYFLVNFKGFNLEVDADCGQRILVEDIIRET